MSHPHPSLSILASTCPIPNTSHLPLFSFRATPSIITRLATLIGNIPTLANTLAKTLGTEADLEVVREAAYSGCKQGIKWSIGVQMAVDEGTEPAPGT